MQIWSTYSIKNKIPLPATMSSPENMEKIEEAKSLVAELCAGLYSQGHVSGTGGGISIRVSSHIVMAPSGVQKERMKAEDMFVLDSESGDVVHTPKAKPPPHKPPKLSECAPLFMSAYRLRNAGAVLHGHSMNAMLASVLCGGNEFKVTQIEMIKGIAGHGFYDVLTVPVIENTARECELTDRLQDAMEKYPKVNAVLVRRHGVYVWGDSWIHAKTQFECFEYLFEAAVRMYSLGLDPSLPPLPAPGMLENGGSVKKQKVLHDTCAVKVKYVVLDIEGTVAPISFVSETLFPYARSRLRSYFTDGWESDEVQHDVGLLKVYALEECKMESFPKKKDEIIDKCVEICESDMNADKKNSPLKSVQGNIWTAGFARGELSVQLFDDVPAAMKDWFSKGLKIYIYSSGSRKAQRDFFSHTTCGDLKPYLQGFFDTTSGSKVETASYKNIALSLGAESGAEILFATDNVLEAHAARTAGWTVAVLDRPGNIPISREDAKKFIVLKDLSNQSMASIMA